MTDDIKLSMDLVELCRRLTPEATLPRIERIEEHLRAILTSPELTPEQRTRVEDFLEEVLQEKAITSHKLTQGAHP